MRIKQLYILLLGLLLLSSATLVEFTEYANIELLSKERSFKAGENIILRFSASNNEIPNLYCTHSYGTTVIEPVLKKNTMEYHIPQSIGNKSGVVFWQLINQNLSGQFEIIPKAKVNSLETYIGPPSIAAGGTDYAMLVVIPTDDLDNPLQVNTPVNIKHWFLASQENDTVHTKNFIAYKNIYSKPETGRILIATDCLGNDSKEYDITILAAPPTNFTISATRHHDYADGNQITQFSTSILKDTYNNVVNDGTYVEFLITNSEGNNLKTSGTTIKGVATASLIHPDYKTQWAIQAFVNGMAKSNSITLNYKQVITDFDIAFKNNTVTVGPLKSFMTQLIPDGLQVSLSIVKEGTVIYSTIKPSKAGYANFNLKQLNLEQGIYSIRVTTARLEKTLQNITYE
jgi:hypothetical protein